MTGARPLQQGDLPRPARVALPLLVPGPRVLTLAAAGTAAVTQTPASYYLVELDVSDATVVERVWRDLQR